MKHTWNDPYFIPNTNRLMHTVCQKRQWGLHSNQTEFAKQIHSSGNMWSWAGFVLQPACDLQLGEMTPYFILMEINSAVPATVSTDTFHMRSYSYLQCKTPDSPTVERLCNHSPSHGEWKARGNILEPWERPVCVCVCVECSFTLGQIHPNYWDQHSEPCACQPSCLEGPAV